MGEVPFCSEQCSDIVKECGKTIFVLHEGGSNIVRNVTKPNIVEEWRVEEITSRRELRTMVYRVV